MAVFSFSFLVLKPSFITEMSALPLMVLIFFLLMILKPRWYVKSTGEKFEKAKKNLRVIGIAGVVGSLLLVFTKILFPN